MEIADRNIKNAAFFCKICEQIQTSYICLVDLTNQRPSVILELGMAFGFQKPIIIIFEEKERKKIEILTDIGWADPIAYKNYTDLKDKLRKTFKELFICHGSSLIPAYDLKDVIKFKNEIELLLDLENLESIPNILEFKLVDGNERIILDQGKNQNIKKGMVFSIHRIEDGIESEKNFGYVEITHPQNNFSQSKVHYADLKYKDEINSILKGKTREIPYILKKIKLKIEKRDLEEMKRIIECLNYLA